MTPTTTISILKSLVIDLDQLSILNLTVPSLKKEVLLMVDKFLKVDCPESPAQQIVQLNPAGAPDGLELPPVKANVWPRKQNFPPKRPPPVNARPSGL